MFKIYECEPELGEEAVVVVVVVVVVVAVVDKIIKQKLRRCQQIDKQ